MAKRIADYIDSLSPENDATLLGVLDGVSKRIPAGTFGGGGGGGEVPNASTTVAGKVELATVGEAQAGTDTSRAVTPEGAKHAAWEFDRFVFAEKHGCSPNASAATNDAAIAAAYSEATSTKKGYIMLPPGVIKVSQTIAARDAVELWGAGGLNASGNPGTTIDGSEISSGPIIQTLNNWWHDAAIRRLRVEKGPSHGIVVQGGMGENATIDQVSSALNGGDGIRIEGPSTPCYLGIISVTRNGGAGLRLVEQQHTSMLILYLSGDNNAESLMTYDTGDADAVLRILNWKAERSDLNGATPGHPDIFYIDDGNGALLDLGYGHIRQTLGGGGGNAVVHQVTTGGGAARVKFRFSYLNDSTGDDYDYAYHDEPHSITTPLAQGARRQITVNEPTLSIHWPELPLFELGAAGPHIKHGVGSPQGTETSPVGSWYVNESDGAWWNKFFGSSSTGWYQFMTLGALKLRNTTSPPSASSAGAGAILMISGVPAYSDGTDWKKLSDDTTIT